MRVLIVGAGIYGLCAAWALKRAGHDAVVFEQATVVGSSRVDLQACKLEYSIVSPK